jgi:hypothetical protein
MGNLMSHPEEITDLQSKVDELDKNKDGLVSKQEFERWSEQQLLRQQQSLELFKERFVLEYEANYGIKIDKLQNENESLKAINIELEKKLTETSEISLENGDSGRPLREISKERITKSVERLIQSETNIKWLPDFVERQLYRNIFNILIGLLDELVTTTSMEILGHTLTMHLEAKTEVKKRERRTTID